MLKNNSKYYILYSLLLFYKSIAQNIVPEIKILIIPLYCKGSIYPAAYIPNSTLNDLSYSINSCSNGKNYISQSSIVSNPYPITCTQNDILTCSNQPKWETQLPVNLNANYGQYYVFMVTPQEYLLSCPIGLGVLDGYRAWIRYDNVDTSVGFFHELGHMFGLDHANTPIEEYGDLSSVMGFCCDFRCHNSAGADYLGWSNIVVNINTQQLQDNIPMIYNTSYNSFDFILIDKNVYLSYRRNIGADKGLQIPWYGHLLVHIMNPNKTTTILGDLSLTDTFGIDVSYNKTITIKPIKFDIKQVIVQIVKTNGSSANTTYNLPYTPITTYPTFIYKSDAFGFIDYLRIWPLGLCVAHVLLGLLP
jgi:hypothetical protein